MEYLNLCRHVVGTLCRKRLSPLLGGRVKTWAAGAIHALGTANFLFDKSLEPYISAKELANAFDLAVSTVGNQPKKIRDLLGRLIEVSLTLEPRFGSPLSIAPLFEYGAESLII